MKYLLLILSMSILLSAELEVDGNLKVTGTIQASTIDSLLSLIAQLEQRIAQLECQNTGIIPDGYCDCFFHTLDLCGVCDGDTTTCQDCAGVPNGDSLQDMCGTCDTDSSNDCVQDCFGELGGMAEYDICGFCGGDAVTEDDCNYSLSFDGNNDWVDIGLPDGMSPTGSHTFMFWIKFDDIVEPPTGPHECNSESIIGGYNDQPVSNRFFWYGIRDCESECPNGYCMTMDFDNSNALVSESFPDNSWVHWALLYNAGTLERSIYRNGQLVAQDIIYSQYNGYMHIILGAMQWDCWGGMCDQLREFYSGNIDDFSVYNYYTTSEEVNSNMNNGLLGTEMGYWNFNEGAGSILYDSSGNENHGTNHGANWVER